MTTDKPVAPSVLEAHPVEESSVSGKTILYLVTEDWYFWSHRLLIARAARDAGANIVVAARMTDHRERIEAERFQAVDVPFDRSGLNPFRDIITLTRLIRTYRQIRPDLVHHVAVKPVLYGSVSAWVTSVPAVVNAMAGLGFLFISQSRKTRFVRAIFEKLFAILGNRANTRLIVQNRDDQTVFEQIGVQPDRIELIRGSGVDTKVFQPTPEPDGIPVAVCVSRMLKDKGIFELVEAGRILKDREVALKLRLVGGTDTNPTSIPIGALERWADDGIIDYAGYSEDIVGEYARSFIAVLPSYREGLPKSLLEAGACGRPIVATDVPGCREICIDGKTGILVPRQNAVALADALEKLARSKDLRHTYGATARRLVEEAFSTQIVRDLTLQLYERTLRERL